jgi:hypothetical protein
VEENQRFPLACLDVIDVDAVGVDIATFALNSRPFECHDFLLFSFSVYELNYAPITLL